MQPTINKYSPLIVFLVWSLASFSARGQQVMDAKVNKNGNVAYNDSIGIEIGYGIERNQLELTSAVDVIYGEQLLRKNVINPANALYGQSVGLQVLQNAGETPTSPTLFIRGKSTFRNSSPLILVDGFEQPFSALTSREIKSISILKDASSLALYGQRGANGVILITTKRGGEHALQVYASVEQGITKPKETPNFLPASTYAKAVNEALANDGLATRYSNNAIKRYKIGNYPYRYPDVNWSDEVLQNFGLRSNYDVTFEGGGSTARYYALINYSRDNGIYKNVGTTEDYNTQIKHGKFNFRSNVDIDLTDNLLFKFNFAGNLANNNVPGGGGSSSNIFNGIYSIPSAAFPVKTPDGNWGGTQIYDNNPKALLSSTGIGRPNEREISLIGTLWQKLDNLTKGLSVEAAVRYNNYNRYTEGQSRSFQYEEYKPRTNNSGEIIGRDITKFGQNTSLNFYGGLNRQRTQFDVLGKVHFKRTFADNKFKGVIFFHQHARSLKGQNNTYHRRNFAANIHYNNSQKYFLDLTASYSGFSVLPPGKRYGFFPAVSAGWVLSKEGFMDDFDLFDILKVRASWGMSGNGNDNFPNYDIYSSQYDYASGYRFQDGNNTRPGFQEVRLASPNFTYSTSRTTNVGIDAKLFRKLGVSLDFFYEHRTDILSGAGGNYSQVIGINIPDLSNGVVDNKGVEATLNWRDKVGAVGYMIGGNFALSRNKIKNSNERYRPFDYLKRTDQRVGQYFGLEAIGFFKDQTDINNSAPQNFGEVKPGDIKYKDQNDDGIINEYDQIPLGYAGDYPEMYYSFSLGINYKHFGINAQFQGLANQNAILNQQSVFRPLINNSNISEYYYKRRWTPQNASSASFPRLTTENNDNNFHASSLWLKNRSYLKLRNLEISYSLPKSLTNSWGMRSGSIYLNGRNLFSIDSIPVMDPEQLYAGYPLLRSYQLGLEVEF